MANELTPSGCRWEMQLERILEGEENCEHNFCREIYLLFRPQAVLNRELVHLEDKYKQTCDIVLLKQGRHNKSVFL